MDTCSLDIFPICFQYTIWNAKECLVAKLLNIFSCNKNRSAFVEMLWDFPIKHSEIISYHLQRSFKECKQWCICHLFERLLKTDTFKSVIQ